MLNTKFTQIFVNLSPHKQVIYGLVTVIFVLAGTIPAIIVKEENDKRVLQTKLDEQDKTHALERQADKETQEAILNRYFDFVEIQLHDSYKLKKEVDSITAVKTQRK